MKKLQVQGVHHITITGADQAGNNVEDIAAQRRAGIFFMGELDGKGTQKS